MCPIEADVQDGFTPIIHPSSISSIIDHPICSSSSVPESELEAARQPALPTPFQGLDLLLLNTPPPNLSLLSKSFTSTAIQLAEPATPLKEVVERSRPRYLFWAEGEGYWEREPISWQEEGKEVRWTRAVKLGALGAEGDGKKARVNSQGHIALELTTKWFYAFTLPPQTLTTPLPVRPANATPSPFGLVAEQLNTNGKKRTAEDDEEVFDDSLTKKAKSGMLTDLMTRLS